MSPFVLASPLCTPRDAAAGHRAAPLRALPWPWRQLPPPQALVRRRCRPPPLCSAERRGSTPPAPELPCLPQTMESAIVDAQQALLRALAEGVRRAVVELPIGRARKFWYSTAPLHVSYHASQLLSRHLLHVLRDADIRIVYDDELCDPPSEADLRADTWLAQRHAWSAQFECDLLADLTESSIVVFVALATKHSHSLRLRSVTNRVPATVPLLLFNCFLDAPFGPDIYPPPFMPNLSVVYLCRAEEHAAFARFQHDAPWSLFVEIAPFEYEFIEDIDAKPDDSYLPTIHNIQLGATRRGAIKPKGQAFYDSASRGCNAGFWPFMSLACPYLLPLKGDTYRDMIEFPEQRKRKTTPFGFF